MTWAFGHLVQLAMPDGYGIRGFVRDNLPIIPETFTLIPRQEKTEKGYKPDSGVVSQIKSSPVFSRKASRSSWRPMQDARVSLFQIPLPLYRMYYAFRAPVDKLAHRQGYP